MLGKFKLYWSRPITSHLAINQKSNQHTAINQKWRCNYFQHYYHHNHHNFSGSHSVIAVKQKTEVSEAKSNCLHSSNHLSLFISPFPSVFSSIRLSSFLCRFSLIHHLVSQSLIPSPSLYSVSIFPSHDTISISCLCFSFSSFSFSPKHRCQPPVISQCVFLLRAVVSPVPASMSPSWRPATLDTAVACGRRAHVWGMCVHTLGLSCWAY